MESESDNGKKELFRKKNILLISTMVRIKVFKEQGGKLRPSISGFKTMKKNCELLERYRYKY